VGCGLDYRSGSVFFTLNGRYLGTAFRGVDTKAWGGKRAEAMEARMRRDMEALGLGSAAAGVVGVGGGGQAGGAEAEEGEQAGEEAEEGRGGQETAPAVGYRQGGRAGAPAAEPEARGDGGLLYPTVGVDSTQAVRLNFGSEEFAFDVDLWEQRSAAPERAC
jgi:hypothetical protein